MWKVFCTQAAQGYVSMKGLPNCPEYIDIHGKYIFIISVAGIAMTFCFLLGKTIEEEIFPICYNEAIL